MSFHQVHILMRLNKCALYNVSTQTVNVSINHEAKLVTRWKPKSGLRNRN